MQITFQHVSYTYDGAYDPALQDVSFGIDASWRLGLIGRNGRGKTTLLHLLDGSLQGEGHINMPLEPVYYPYTVQNMDDTAAQICYEAAPDLEWWQLERELRLLGLKDEVLDRPFRTLSPGERTKVLLAALFARDDIYPLIDEPTNHLDLASRQQVAAYLQRKNGFLLVSHDRAFLNSTIDHVLSINRSDIWVMQGNYDTWQDRYDNQQAFETARNETLRSDIHRLEESARKAAAWSANAEKGKFHVAASDVAAVDRGYVGARAAAMMKRSSGIVRRKEKEIAEKSTLLKNTEHAGELKLVTLPHPKETLIEIMDGCIRYGDHTVAEHIRLTVKQGDRIALTGPNGSGKSSLLKSLLGSACCLQGETRIAPGLIISSIPQEIEHLTGSLQDFMTAQNVDETLFKAILRLCGFAREEFDHPLQGLSQGQRKKLLLAASLCKPAHLYLWDEPLNYLDVLSRIQLEQLILTARPTMLLVEHDATFIDRVCTGQIPLQKAEEK